MKLGHLKAALERKVKKSQEDLDKITFYQSAIYAYEVHQEYMTLKQRSVQLPA